MIDFVLKVCYTLDMGKFNFIKTDIEGLFVIEPKIFEDSRGYFCESYNYNDFCEAGITEEFVQDNESVSSKGVLRGLHFQKSHPQSKLVRVVSGEVFDVAVDLRENSPTFGKYYGVVLSDTNKKQFFIPKGFAHGFLVLSEKAKFCYKCDEFYFADDQFGIRFDDSDIGIDWGKYYSGDFILSEKDNLSPTLKEYLKNGGK